MDNTDRIAMTERIEGWNANEETITQIPAEAYTVWADYRGYIADTLEEFESWASDAEEHYEGDYGSDIEFAKEMADTLGAVPDDLEWPMSHIDWESAARDLMYDYFEDLGYYFRNA